MKQIITLRSRAAAHKLRSRAGNYARGMLQSEGRKAEESVDFFNGLKSGWYDGYDAALRDVRAEMRVFRSESNPAQERANKLLAVLRRIGFPSPDGRPGPDLFECIRIAAAVVREDLEAQTETETADGPPYGNLEMHDG